MPLTTDITATYRGPSEVMRRLLRLGPREDRALAFVMAFCTIAFIARLPALARQAHLEERDLSPLMGGALMGTLFVLPLILYLIAGLSYLVARVLGGQGTGYGARLALFWSLLASTPLILLNGLVAGFMGNGPALKLVGLVWLLVFLWFWASTLTTAQKVSQ